MELFSIYVIQMLYILICGYVFKNSKRRFLIAAFIALFVVMAFRNATKIGVDSVTSYYGAFVNIQESGISWPNPGLTFVMKMINRFTGDYQWVIIISAAWVCFAYYKLLLKYSENAFISVMWFMGMLFYTFLFDALKQAWAMGFLCFAFDAIFEKKPFRFFIFVGLAVTFHFPALIFLPAYWIAKLKLNKFFPIIMAAVFLFVFVFRTQILNLMNSTYGRGEVNYSSEVRFWGTKAIFMVLMLAYGFYQFFSQNHNDGNSTKLFPALLYFMGIASVIQTFCFYSNNFERLADYYYQFSILFVPLILLEKRADSNTINENNMTNMFNASKSDEELYHNSLAKYSSNSFGISTLLFVVVFAFCVYRYLANMLNDVYFSPFYFFWQ